MATFTISGGQIFSTTGTVNLTTATAWNIPSIPTPGGNNDAHVVVYFPSNAPLNGSGFPSCTIATAPSGFFPHTTLRLDCGLTSVNILNVGNTFTAAGAFSSTLTVTPGTSTSTFALQTFPDDSPLGNLTAIVTYIAHFVQDGTGSAYGDAASVRITGTYLLVFWYYNAVTNHYQFSETDPGAPWTLSSTPTPTITSVKRYSTYTESVPSVLLSPAYGAAGTTITITGTGFGDGATVTVCGSAATSVVVVDSTTITAVVPAHADGACNVVVTNPDSTTATSTGGFTYGTPWWTRTNVYGGRTYYAYWHFATAPATGTWVINPAAFAPDFTDPDGWYSSDAAFGGNVVVTSDGVPGEPRAWADISVWATSDTGMLGGSPAASCLYRNHLLYPATGYTVGTQYPPIRVFDGSFDHELCRLPPTTSNTVPQAVLSMLTANGTIYLTTFDSGTSSATWAGRVLQLDLDSATLTPIGDGFSGGEMPYALAWHQGRLWVGTNNGIGTVGKVYWFRPGIDTAWTLDHATSAESAGGVDALISYGGKLYVGTDNAAASRGKVLVRDSAGAYTISDTGTGGTAHVNNGYLAFAVLGANLYASYWNNDATAISLIKKFDGTTWTTAYTGASTTLRPFMVLTLAQQVLFAVGGGKLLAGALVSTPDGTTWTNLTAQLPETDRTLLPMAGAVAY